MFCSGDSLGYNTISDVEAVQVTKVAVKLPHFKILKYDIKLLITHSPNNPG